MTTFHNVACKIETSFKIQVFKLIMKTRKVNDKCQNLILHAEDATDNLHFMLNITTK